MWGNLERCHRDQFDDGTRKMMKLACQEALTDNACSNLLELQKEAGLLSWNKAGENGFIFACHLANKLEIEVQWDPFNEYTISAALTIMLPSSLKQDCNSRYKLWAKKYLSSASRLMRLGLSRQPQLTRQLRLDKDKRHRSFACKILRIAKEVFQATRYQGDTALTIQPFFKNAGRGNERIWGEEISTPQLTVINWSGLDKKEKLDLIPTLSATDNCILLTQPLGVRNKT
jgi:hypothetical protein